MLLLRTGVVKSLQRNADHVTTDQPQASQSTHHPSEPSALQNAPNLQGMSMGADQATSMDDAQSGAGSKVHSFHHT